MLPCYPVLHFHEFAHAFCCKNVFSIIDLVRAYKQISFIEDDITKTAFTRPLGLSEFPFMSFGLCNAAQTCQRFIDEVLLGLAFLYVYIDDIQIASSLEKEHLQRLHQVFDRLRAHGIVGP